MIGKIKYRMNSMRRKDSNTARPDRRSRTESLAEDRDEGSYDFDAPKRRRDSSRMEERGESPAYRRKKEKSGPQGWDGITAFHKKKEASGMEEWDESPAYRRKKEGIQDGVSAFHRKKEASGYQNAGSGADEREDFPVRKKKAGAVWPGRREPSYAEAAPVHAPESEKKQLCRQKNRIWFRKKMQRCQKSREGMRFWKHSVPERPLTSCMCWTAARTGRCRRF